MGCGASTSSEVLASDVAGSKSGSFASSRKFGSSFDRSPGAQKTTAFSKIRVEDVTEGVRCHNVIAIALAVTALGFPTTVREVLAATALPIQAVVDDSMPLALTFDLASRFVVAHKYPLQVEVVHFDDGTVTVDDFRSEVQRSAHCDGDVMILHFRSNTADPCASDLSPATTTAPAPQPQVQSSNAFASLLPPAGSYALLTDYHQHLDEVVVAEVNQKQSLLFWACSLERMFRACSMKDTDVARARGLVRISTSSTPTMSKCRIEAPIWQKLAAPSQSIITAVDVPLRPLLHLMHTTMAQALTARVRAASSDGNHSSAAARTPPASAWGPHVQVRCSGVVAVAAALSVVGHASTVDDVFALSQLPLHHVLSDSMPLAHVFAIACRVVRARRYNVKVEAVHFDEGAVTEADFRQFLRHSGSPNRQHPDAIVLNFRSSTAHNVVGLGEGHYALLAGFDSSADTALVADVAPRRFLRYWQCPVRWLYRACCDKEPAVNRARGLLRVSSLTDAASLLPLGYPQTSMHQNVPRVHSFLTLRYHEHDHHLFYSLHLCAVAMAITALGYRASIAGILATAAQSVHSCLDDRMLLSEAHHAAVAYVASRAYPLRVDVVHFDPGSISERAFRTEVQRWCGEGGSVSSVPIAAFKADLPVGLAGVGAHFALIASYNESTDECVMVDPYPHRHLPCWSCPLPRLYRACCQVDGYTKRARGLLILSRASALASAGLHKIEAPLTLGVLNGDAQQAGLGPGAAGVPVATAVVVDHARGGLLGIDAREFRRPLRCVNLTAAAVALTACACPTTVDNMLATLELPLQTMGNDRMTLADTHDLVCRYIAAHRLRVSVEVIHFDKAVNWQHGGGGGGGGGGSSSSSGGEQAAGPSVTWLRREMKEAVRDDNDCDVLVLHFRVDLAHQSAALGVAGHYALLADYNAESDELLLLDTNQTKYPRTWWCSLPTMLAACSELDASSHRARGLLRFSKTPTVSSFSTGPASRPPARWRCPHVVSSAAIKRRRKQHVVDLASVCMPQWLLPVASFAVTAVAYAFAALGVRITLEEFYSAAQLGVVNVFNDCIPLPQAYNLATTVVHARKFPLQVSMQVAEGEAGSLEQFLSVLRWAQLTVEAAIVVAFSLSLHSSVSLREASCTHYAIVADFDEASGQVMLADSNPKRFTRFWQCSVSALYAAMLLLDRTNGRPRGWLTVRPSQALLAGAGVHEPKQHPVMLSQIYLPEFQYAGSCACSAVVAVAYALSAAGFATSVADVFLTNELAAHTLVHAAMSLHDTYHLANKYARLRNLPLRVEMLACGRVDASVPVVAPVVLSSVEAPVASTHLVDSTASPADGGLRAPVGNLPQVRQAVARHADCDVVGDVVLCVFHAHIVHGGDGDDGPHVALLSDYSSITDTVTLADVDHCRFPNSWSVPLPLLYDACESASSGLLRLMPSAMAALF